MITQELIDYVKTQLSAGVAREKVTSDLLGQGGWTIEQINEAFQATQQTVPQQVSQSDIVFEMTEAPKNIKYFEWLMYGSFAISIVAGLIQLGSNINLAIILPASIGYLIPLAFVYLIVYKRMAWPRMVLVALIALGSFSILAAMFSFFNGFDITSLILMIPVLLEIVAIYFVFTKDSSAWLSKVETVTETDSEGNVVSISAIPAPGGSKMNIWNKAIPRTNWITAIVASGLFLFSVFGVGGGLDVFDDSTLGEFAQLMLATMIGFGFFVLLENFVFHKSLKARPSSGLDPWLMMLISARNVAVILSVIPLIQLLGVRALGIGGIPWLLIYVVLLFLRFREANNEAITN